MTSKQRGQEVAQLGSKTHSIDMWEREKCRKLKQYQFSVDVVYGDPLKARASVVMSESGGGGENLPLCFTGA